MMQYKTKKTNISLQNNVKLRDVRVDSKEKKIRSI